MGRGVALLLVSVEFGGHEVIELEGADTPTHYHAQVIAEEFQDVVIVLDGFIAAQELAFLGILNVPFDGHQPLFPSLGEKLVKKL